MSVLEKIKLIIDQKVNKINTLFPAKVIEVGTNTCTIKPKFYYEFEHRNQTYKREPPLIRDVPVMYMRGGNSIIMMPISVGDIVFVACSQHSLKKLLINLENVKVEQTKEFSLDGAVILGGFIIENEFGETIYGGITFTIPSKLTIASDNNIVFEAPDVKGLKITYTESFINTLAEDTDHVVVAEDLTQGTPITCSISEQPDEDRNVTIIITDSDVSITAFSITVNGTDSKGEGASEIFVFADGLTQTGNVAFATIASVIVTSITGAGSGDILDVGIGSKLGLSNPIDAVGDVFKVKKNTDDYASANYTVDTTYDTVDVSTGGAIVGGDNFKIFYKGE